MSETKHTPGPWEIESCLYFGQNYGNTGVRTVHEDGYELCRGSWTRTLATVPHDLRTNDPVIEANLRLMAAAPELLEALKGLTGWEYRHALSCQHPHVNPCMCQNHIMDRALAAVAKAEGRS